MYLTGALSRRRVPVNLLRGRWKLLGTVGRSYLFSCPLSFEPHCPFKALNNKLINSGCLRENVFNFLRPSHQTTLAPITFTFALEETIVRNRLTLATLHRTQPSSAPTLSQYQFFLIHANRQGEDISFTVCLFLL